ncbi:protocatechuate 4,5-dioxygenase subunit alpha [Altererythrobacter sp. CC-YST694]|uniref:protocatechuate 4,5-dioxygenase subunit alpha n=1 Tax=Altererythrobacter sp. CC-YST694 TaxID=2755038 RepID=UPI001D027814|nr:protocatechuate 4,5-dioxygenase subunit alpha [Altererythrobacter sp. CC-YST694]MCB5426016.1 protocatechuate 4,5-dioxygenase subunit alpha [Altererythrobacter sp. CC-YST694]
MNAGYAESGKRQIFGTEPFDGDLAMRGYALNAMCYSFNAKDNRDAFAADEEGYMARFGLTNEQKAAVRNRDVLAMLDAGGNVYYLAKLAGILGLNVQDLGALQTGMTLDAFKAALLSHGETTRRAAA